MDDRERIAKLRELMLGQGDEYKELDGEKVSKMYFVAGLAKVCAQDSMYAMLHKKYTWIEPLMLCLASEAFDSAIEIQKELQDEDR